MGIVSRGPQHPSDQAEASERVHQLLPGDRTLPLRGPRPRPRTHCLTSLLFVFPHYCPPKNLPSLTRTYPFVSTQTILGSIIRTRSPDSPACLFSPHHTDPYRRNLVPGVALSNQISNPPTPL